MSLKVVILIVIILILLFFVATFSFITTSPASLRVSGRDDKRIELVDSSCIEGKEAVIMVRNAGNTHLTLAPGGDVTMIDASSGLVLGGSWYPLGSNVPTTGVEPGDVVWRNASCTGLCDFRFDVNGRVGFEVSLYC